MTTAMPKSKWYLPGFSLLLGLLFFGAHWAGDDPKSGVWALMVMIAFGALSLVAGRFELVRGLRGDGRDEYWSRIDVHATALAGTFAVVLILAMCAWEWAHGRSGTPYVQLGALTGVAYLAAVGLLRWRS